MKWPNFQLAMVVMALSSAIQHAYPQTLALSLRLDSDSFLESQGIWAFLTLTNNTAQPQDSPTVDPRP